MEERPCPQEETIKDVHDGLFSKSKVVYSKSYWPYSTVSCELPMLCIWEPSWWEMKNTCFIVYVIHWSIEMQRKDTRTQRCTLVSSWLLLGDWNWSWLSVLLWPSLRIQFEELLCEVELRTGLALWFGVLWGQLRGFPEESSRLATICCDSASKRCKRHVDEVNASCCCKKNVLEVIRLNYLFGCRKSS